MDVAECGNTAPDFGYLHLATKLSLHPAIHRAPATRLSTLASSSASISARAQRPHPISALGEPGQFVGPRRSGASALSSPVTMSITARKAERDHVRDVRASTWTLTLEAVCRRNGVSRDPCHQPRSVSCRFAAHMPAKAGARLAPRCSALSARSLSLKSSHGSIPASRRRHAALRRPLGVLSSIAMRPSSVCRFCITCWDADGGLVDKKMAADREC